MRKDPKVGTGKKPKGSGRRLYTDENPKDTVSIKFATPADARNGWILTTEQHSYRVFDKFISRSGNIVTYDHQYVKDIGESTRHIQQTNCSAWTRRTKFDFGWSNWSEILPETVADYTARAMCG